MPKSLQVSVVYKGRELSSRTFDTGSILIGRDPDCDVRLDSIGVSRQHARIDRHGLVYLLRDLGSTQGITVNDEAITSRTIQDGEQAKIARFSLHFRIVDVANRPADPEPSCNLLGEMETMRAVDLDPTEKESAVTCGSRSAVRAVRVETRVWYFVIAAILGAGAMYLILA